MVKSRILRSHKTAKITRKTDAKTQNTLLFSCLHWNFAERWKVHVFTSCLNCR